jgi:hypothetical protein
MDEDLLAFQHWLQHATRQIRWRRLARPPLIDTVREAASGEATPTHEGILDIPGVGPVPAYKLATGEVVFEAETLCRLFGIEEPDDAH